MTSQKVFGKQVSQEGFLLQEGEVESRKKLFLSSLAQWFQNLKKSGAWKNLRRGIMNHIRLEGGYKSMHLMGKEIERGVLLIWLCFRVDRKMSDPLLHKGPLFRCR